MQYGRSSISNAMQRNIHGMLKGTNRGKTLKVANKANQEITESNLMNRAVTRDSGLTMIPSIRQGDASKVNTPDLDSKQHQSDSKNQ